MSTRAQLLKRRGGDELPADVTASVDEIVTDTRTLTEILEDLLIAADPRTVVEPTPVDLVTVAENAVGLLRDDAGRRGISLARAGDPEPIIIPGSRAALLRLVIALSTNALDHARTAVTVTVSASNGNAIVRVTDDGPGFSSEVASTAFDRFVSSRNVDSTTRHYGLGLAIVAEIVQRHRGTVTIEQPSTGASVTCIFPLGPA
ncbi:HAMP domain-containing sensor histidine kinase [Microbacterium sp. Se63.02b]|uniref:sensor histidine kinase n=1 Tax=Microbacterium sp. Se63.02b TaxID=2709304 RepID=UPI001604C77C|nr:HAMP domain-containing sensor histidine kinase [Microbacterium sp. Se63.02b]QNA92956.1 HAMP domain-containing histidine kinase [Microbacterium sp. Se63.02b]QYM63120.1 HAMP domain-containing histidine kinase [Microbacterium sp. Se5.02b]